MEELVTYRKFNNREEAKELFDLLTENGLEAELEDASERFNPSFASTPFSIDFRVRLLPSDFPRADDIVFTDLGSAIQSIDPDYYLFSFSEEELKEVLVKKDEWSPFDYFLAGKLLRDAGADPDSEELSARQQERMQQLAKPEKSPVGLIVIGYICALFGGFLGFFFGWLLFSSKRTLPNGESVYNYKESDRKHGRYIFALAVLSIVVSLLILWYDFI